MGRRIRTSGSGTGLRRAEPPDERTRHVVGERSEPEKARTGPADPGQIRPVANDRQGVADQLLCRSANPGGTPPDPEPRVEGVARRGSYWATINGRSPLGNNPT